MNARKLLSGIAVVLAGLVCHVRYGAQAQDTPPPQIKLDPQFLIQQLFSISNNKVLLKELEIVDSQSTALNQISQHFQKKLVTISLANQKIMIQAQQEGKSVNYDDYLKPLDELSVEMEQELDKILLAHQAKRIKQLAIRQQLQLQSGYSDDLSLPLTLAGQLELSSAELKALKETVQETRSAYEEEIQKLQRRARDKILKSLPADKRELFLDIVGDSFDFDASQRALRENFQSASPQAVPLLAPVADGADAEDKPKK